MTLVNIEYQSLDEVVFENRNKSYGAYLLRKTYSQHVNAAIFITAALCTLLIGIPSISRWLDKGNPIVPIVEKPTDKGTLTLERIEILPPPPKGAIARSTSVANLVPEVTKEVVIDPPKPPIEQATLAVNGIDEGAIGGLDSGTEGGTGEVIPALNIVPVEKVEGPMDFAEQMPEFPGGNAQLIKYLSKKLQYPRIAQQTETQGKVLVQFVVNRDGKITDVTVVKGVSKECDEEAIRVVQSMPNWTPGKQNGRTVSVKYIFPIVFKMGE